MDRRKLAAHLAKIDSLPTLPAFVSRVLTVTNDPESSARELVDAIAPDQSMTVKILKMANSAHYIRLRKVSTLQQALMVLGFEEVRNLVLSSAVFNNFKTIRKIKGFDAHMFWRHSYAVGLAAKLLSSRLQLPSGEAFVAGLIHDIGKLVLITLLGEEYIQTLGTQGGYGMENLAAEKRMLSVNHTEAGMRVLKRWMFPNQLMIAAGFHHRPDPEDSLMAYPFVVHLGDLLAHMIVLSQNLDEQHVFPEDCFSPATLALTDQYGIDWQMDSVCAWAAELRRQMDAHADVMELFFE